MTGIGTALDGVETLALVIPYGHQGKSVTAIGEWAFTECDGLTSIVIPDSVISVGEGAFRGCEGLTGVYISDLSAWCKIDFGNKIDFGDYGANPLCYAHHLYLDNIEITTLNIPEDIVEIKDYAFSDCDGLTSVTIPDSVTSIGDSTFSYCGELTSVIIPDSMTSIGYAVFNRVRDTTAKSKILSKQPLSRA